MGSGSVELPRAARPMKATARAMAAASERDTVLARTGPWTRTRASVELRWNQRNPAAGWPLSPAVAARRHPSWSPKKPASRLGMALVLCTAAAAREMPFSLASAEVLVPSCTQALARVASGIRPGQEQALQAAKRQIPPLALRGRRRSQQQSHCSSQSQYDTSRCRSWCCPRKRSHCQLSRDGSRPSLPEHCCASDPRGATPHA